MKPYEDEFYTEIVELSGIYNVAVDTVKIIYSSYGLENFGLPYWMLLSNFIPLMTLPLVPKCNAINCHVK